MSQAAAQFINLTEVHLDVSKCRESRHPIRDMFWSLIDRSGRHSDEVYETGYSTRHVSVRPEDIKKISGLDATYGGGVNTVVQMQDGERVSVKETADEIVRRISGIAPDLI
jgi:hypothetical protein